MEWHYQEYRLSDDPAELDLDAVMLLLGQTYWAANRPREVVVRSIENSLAFGLYHAGKQVAFARVVTDTVTFSWLSDVVLDPAHRGRGVAKWMIETILAHPSVAPTRQLLATRDAQTLYERYGFQEAEAGCFLTRGFQKFRP